MLDMLFPNVTRDVFLRDFWLRDRPLVDHGDAARFDAVADLPELQSVEAIARAHTWGTAATLLDPEAHVRAIERLSWQNATQLYNVGATVHFNGVNATLPSVHEWCLELCRELGLLPSFIRCTAFLARAGGGTPKHCDDKDTFVIQLAGEKTWFLAPNEDLQHPFGSVWPWAAHSGAEHLRDMPANRREVTLRPGSVLFVPRNYWHATECLSDTTAITIGFQRPPWSKVLTTMLEAALVTDPRWRAAVGSAWGTDDQRRDAADALRALMQTLPDKLASLDFAQFLDAQQHPEQLDRYRHRDGARARLGDTSDGLALLVEDRAADFEAELPVDDTVAPLVRWVLDRREFSLREAAASTGELDVDATRSVLEILIEAQLLEPVRQLEHDGMQLLD